MKADISRLAMAGLVASIMFSAPAWADSATVAASAEAEFQRVEGLPDEAPRTGTLITVDTSRNLVYLFRDGELVARAPAATGSNRYMKKGLREWLFRTPHGRQQVLRKIVGPIWSKPDWAYVEEGRRIPPPDAPDRLVRGKMGKYALDLGDGIMIHGTDEKSSLGKNASHGCIRLGDEMMEKVFRAADVGTEVWVF